MTLKSLQGTSIEDYGYQLGRAWGIGQKGKNNGALLIVAPNERKVRIEVGYGLEGALTDAVTRLIIENAILPRFRANDFPGGIARGVDDMIQVVSGDAEEFKRRAAQRPDDAPQAIDAATLFMVAARHLRHHHDDAEQRWTRPAPAAPARRLFGPIFIPSGGSWSSGSSAAIRRRRFLGRRRLVRGRRLVGELVMMNSPTPTAHRIIEAIRQAETQHLRRDLLRASRALRAATVCFRSPGRRRLALLVPLPLIYLTAWPAIVIYALQLAAFLGALYLLTREAIRYRIVPRQTKHDRAHQEALRQFGAHGLQHTELRTGVLIFVSVAEHYAEIVADAGIDQKVTPRGVGRTRSRR